MNISLRKLLSIATIAVFLQACSDNQSDAALQAPAAAPKPAAVSETAQGISMEEAYTWIDVRTAEEFATGAVSKAINIPHTEIVEKIASVADDKDAPIYVYCRSGNRSGKAKAALEAVGYTNVTNLGGVKDALVHAGEAQ